MAYRNDYARKLRKQLELTRPQFAPMCGLSVDALQKIERGINHPRPSTIRKIARGFTEAGAPHVPQDLDPEYGQEEEAAADDAEPERKTA